MVGESGFRGEKGGGLGGKRNVAMRCDAMRWGMKRDEKKMKQNKIHSLISITHNIS